MKRILSLLICYILLITCIGASAEDTVNADVLSVGDMEDVSYSAMLLDSLGIVPSFPTDYTAPVSRADFLTTVVSLLGMSGDGNIENEFYDVSVSDSFNGAVNAALNLKIVSPGNFFRPDDAIKYSEAYKMVVEALGYGFDAGVYGGYPAGYQLMTDRLELNDGISADFSSPLSSGNAYILLGNMLSAKVRMPDSVIADNPELFVTYGDSCPFLTFYYNLYEVSGIVTADSKTHIYDANEAADEGSIKIDDKSYRCSENIPVGSYVEGWAISEGNLEIIKHIRTDSDSVLTLYPTACAVYENNTIKYFDSDNKEKKVRLENITAFIYNGKAQNGCVASDFNIETGKLVLIDCDDDRVYDTVHIFSGNVGYADIVNHEAKTITDRYGNSGKSVVFDISDAEKYSIYGSDGTPGGISKISSGSSFEYYVSKDGLYTMIYVLDDTITGKLEGMSNGSLVIDGKLYETTSYFNNRYRGFIRLGTTNTFVLTRSGSLATCMSGSGTDTTLGYIDAYAKSGDLDKRLMLKIFTENGNLEIYDVADNVKVGDKVMNMQEIEGYLASNTVELIRFRCNSKGQISAIFLPSAPGSNRRESIYRADADGLDVLKPYVIDGATEDMTISYKSFGAFVPYFTIDNDTKIFCINTSEGVGDKEKYKIGSPSSWGNDTDFSFSQISAYNVTSACRAGILVIKSSDGEAIDDDGVVGGIIESVTNAFNNEGREALKIVVCADNTYSTVYLEKEHDSYQAATDKEAKTDLAPGDYILYTKDVYSNLISYVKDFDYSEGSISDARASDSDNSVLVYYYGTLSAVENQSLAIDIIDSSGPVSDGFISLKAQYMNRETSYAWLVETDERNGSSVVGIPMRNISNYMDQGYEVFVRTRFADITEIVIYNKRNNY